jgi:integrase/recombinase XerD
MVQDSEKNQNQTNQLIDALYKKKSKSKKKKGQKQKEVLTTGEIKKLIQNAKSVQTQLMISVLVETGMRVGELINFKPNWINHDNRSIRVQENKEPIEWSPKTEGSTRVIPISRNLLNNLKRHLGNRRKGYMFKSQKRKSGQKGHLGDRIEKQYIDYLTIYL